MTDHSDTRDVILSLCLYTVYLLYSCIVGVGLAVIGLHNCDRWHVPVYIYTCTSKTLTYTVIGFTLGLYNIYTYMYLYININTVSAWLTLAGLSVARWCQWCQCWQCSRVVCVCTDSITVRQVGMYYRTHAPLIATTDRRPWDTVHRPSDVTARDDRPWLSPCIHVCVTKHWRHRVHREPEFHIDFG